MEELSYSLPGCVFVVILLKSAEHAYLSLFCIIGKGGDLQKIGEFCLIFSELPFLSEPIPPSDPPQIGGVGGNQTGGPGNQPLPVNAAPPLASRPPGNGRQQNGAWPTTPVPSSGPTSGNNNNGSAPFQRGPAPPSKVGGKRDPRKR